MKHFLPLLTAFLFSFSLYAQNNTATVALKDGVDKGLLEYEIHGAWDLAVKLESPDGEGQYFGKSVNLKLRNKTRDTLYVSVENGRELLSADTMTQNMVITRSDVITLLPGAVKTVQLYAMCTEIFDGMPHSLSNYNIGEMGDVKLCMITQSIEDRLMQNVAGQGAVWAYTVNASAEDLRNYGATDASIAITRDILDKAGIITPINPAEEGNKGMDSAKSVEKASSAPAMEAGTVMLKTWQVYMGAAVILIQLLSAAYLMMVRKGIKEGEDTE